MHTNFGGRIVAIDFGKHKKWMDGAKWSRMKGQIPSENKNQWGNAGYI
jgi:hypothetical protein